MPSHLLDTTILSHALRYADGVAARRMMDLGDALCTSAIVASELRYGAIRKGSERLRRQVEEILRIVTVLPYAAPADEHYGAIRVALEARGQTISANDLFIAAHARSADLTLVTDNTAEFIRVPDLRLENWLR